MQHKTNSMKILKRWNCAPDQKLSLGEVPMWAGQYRKYPRKYGAQAWKYPWICRRNVTFSGLGPTMAGEDVELPIISGPLSKTYSFRDLALQWQARMLNCPSSLAHCRKPTLFGTRSHNGRRGCWNAPHLWPIVDNQLKTECWYCAGCGNSPIAGAAPGLQYWLCSGPKMTCLGYYHVLHLLPALPFCWLCANIFMFTTVMRSRCIGADFIKYTHCFWISDFGKIVFFHTICGIYFQKLLTLCK